MSDLHRPLASNAPAKSAASWERSFPRGSVQGDAWINAVMEDLQNYSEHHKMDRVTAVLAQARTDLRNLLN